MPAGRDQCPVTVIVPTYNRSASLRTAIRSVLRQTHRELRLVVVDDGSTDDSAAQIQSIADPRLRLIRHGTNRGAAAARNTGLRAADTRYVAFLDSDDLWAADKLERQLAFLEAAAPPVAACATAHYVHRRPDAPAALRNARLPSLGLPEIIDHDTLCLGSTLMVELACFAAVGEFDATLRRLEDWEWSLRFAARYALPVLPRPLAHVSVGTGRAIGDAVAASAARIVALHAERFDRDAPEWGRRLRATAAWHTAYGFHVEGRLARAAWFGLEAIRLDPRRRLPALGRWLARRCGLDRRDMAAATPSWRELEQRLA